MTGTEVESIEPPAAPSRRPGARWSPETHPERIPSGGPGGPGRRAGGHGGHRSGQREGGAKFPDAPPERPSTGRSWATRDSTGGPAPDAPSAEDWTGGSGRRRGLRPCPRSPGGTDFRAWAAGRPGADGSSPPIGGSLLPHGVAREVHGLLEDAPAAAPFRCRDREVEWRNPCGASAGGFGCEQYALGYGENFRIAPAPPGGR
jgi:hypothetical protein